MSVVLDTHTAIWYLQDSKQLSPKARKAIEKSIQAAQVAYLSAISLVELIYLAERGRLPMIALQRLKSALEDETSGISIAPVDAAIADALAGVPGTTIPDMPDRIIVATAVHLGLPLVTPCSPDRAFSAFSATP